MRTFFQAAKVRLYWIMIYVRKADGTFQQFDREKVKRTARNLGVPLHYHDRIADEVEMRIYDGISTSKILQIIHTRARIYMPAVEFRTNLRRAIAQLRPKPDFEQYVQLLLSEIGYVVEPGRILAGLCGEHEVDAIVRKDGVVFFVEVKHHFNHHRMTGLDEGRIARAIIEDVQEGYRQQRNHFSVDGAMIVCNTKLSDHAKKYASCWGIEHIGWDHPHDQNLQRMIEETQLYPVNYIRGVKPAIRKQLMSAGIITLRQLVDADIRELVQRTGLSAVQVELLVERGEKILM